MCFPTLKLLSTAVTSARYRLLPLATTRVTSAPCTTILSLKQKGHILGTKFDAFGAGVKAFVSQQRASKSEKLERTPEVSDS